MDSTALMCKTSCLCGVSISDMNAVQRRVERETRPNIYLSDKTIAYISKRDLTN